MDRELVGRVAHMGLLLVDDDAALAELVRRDAELEANQWNLYGALLHFLTKWRDIDLGWDAGIADADELPEATLDMIDEFVTTHGPAPPAFHARADAVSVTELPLVERSGGLYDALLQRRTSRRFDRGASMTVEQLSTILRYVFGCHGYAGMARDGMMIKRTSPSGGGLHAIEAYPFVARVDGVPCGLYHYNVRDHSLELIAPVDAGAVPPTAETFLSGQRFFAAAHVHFILTARFYRSFWKYRRHQKAYASLLLDAGHLSQTLYLVAAELGLGAYVTAAVNGANIEERLGIDGSGEGVLGILGCGIRGAGRSPIEPDFLPYVPRATQLPR
jgi:putative peptide maturation dehydrogenase